MQNVNPLMDHSLVQTESIHLAHLHLNWVKLKIDFERKIHQMK